MELVTTGSDVTTQYINASGYASHNLVLVILRKPTKEGILHKMLKTSIFAVLVACAIFFLFTGKWITCYDVTWKQVCQVFWSIIDLICEMCPIRRHQCGLRSRASPDNTNTPSIILDNIDSGVNWQTEINMTQSISFFGKIRIILMINRSIK